MKLNEGNNEVYKLFSGKSHEQIPILIGEGRKIMDSSQLMSKRLEYRGFEPSDTLESQRKLKVGRNWIANYSVSTADTAWYNPQTSSVKIVLNDQYLRDTNRDSPVDRLGRFHVSTDLYKAVEGVEFTRDELCKLGLEKKVELSKKQALNFPIWQLLAKDKDLSDEYLEFVFEQVGQKKFAAGFSPLPRLQGSQIQEVGRSDNQCYMIPISIGPMSYEVNSNNRSSISGEGRLRDNFVGINAS